MVRIKLGLLAAALTAGAAVGCAQCDTCDDFPTPCVGGNCGPQQANPMMATGTYTMVTPGPGPVAPMILPPGAPLPPGVTSAPSAGAVPVPTSGASAPSSDAVPPPPPPPPSDTVTPPPPDSAGNSPRPIN